MRYILILVSLQVACGSVVAIAGKPPVEEMLLERKQVHMGTWLTVRLEGASRESLLPLSAAIFSAVATTEADWSSWRPETPLSQLNRAGVAEAVPWTPEMWEVLVRLEDLRKQTGGAFNPFAGGSYRRLEAGLTPVPGNAPTLAALAWDAATMTVQKKEAVEIAEGGFAKGLALDVALEVARNWTPRPTRVVLDFGGQVLHWSSNGETFEVALASPHDRGRPTKTVALGNQSIATTGNSEKKRPHIINPRTGSYAPDFGNVSVIAPTAFEADCLSTGLFVLGPHEGSAVATGCEDVHAHFQAFDADQNIRKSGDHLKN